MEISTILFEYVATQAEKVHASIRKVNPSIRKNTQVILNEIFTIFYYL